LGLSERLAICRQLAIQIVDVEFVHDASSSIRENQEVLDEKEASALIRKHLIVDVKTEISCQADDDWFIRYNTAFQRYNQILECELLLS
jgi:hypothetical protein